MVPLQLPGGPELLVVLLVLLFLFGIPIVLLALGVIGFRRTADDDRVEELESRVAELEDELEAERSELDGDAGTTGSDDSRKA